MPDSAKHHEKKHEPDEERRNVAKKPGVDQPAPSGGPALAVANERPETAKAPRTLEPAGPGIRATGPGRPDPGARREEEAAKEVDSSPPLEEEDEDIPDPSDASSPIDERTERRKGAHETPDEEER